LTEYRCVTDRQTSCHSIVHAMHTRSVVKMVRMLHMMSSHFKFVNVEEPLNWNGYYCSANVLGVFNY